MPIRTKIVATIGPASGEVKTLSCLAEAGADAFRINFSHGTPQQHQEFLDNVRQVESQLGRPLAVIADLCGPKIRVGPIVGGSVLLADGQEIFVQRHPIEGGPQRISTTLAELVDDIAVGQTLLLDDGRLRLEVIDIQRPERFACRVVRGGVLGSGAGMNLPHTATGLSALTEKDRRDVEWLMQRDFDYVALSFVRSAQDVQELRELLARYDSRAHIIAKIEKPQAVENIQAILAAADAIMIARGDLGVEMDLPAVPVAQKQIARLCQTAGKGCIVATQMLQSMTVSPTPTRAEVSDVANAVLDHTDAVMLSGETAVGKYPVQSVDMMNRIVESMQAYYDATACPEPVTLPASQTTAALAGAVRRLLETEPIAAVAVFTTTGTTAQVLAKNRLQCPILALSPDTATVRRLCLYYGVVSVQAEAPSHTRDILALASKCAVQRQIAKSGQKIIVLSGRPIGQAGTTNTLVVHTVE